jgi:hypothetical protein
MSGRQVRRAVSDVPDACRRCSPEQLQAAVRESRIVSRTIAKTPGELFGKTNPCKVPDSSPADCVLCPAYSAGTSVAVQVPCGSGTRTMRRLLPDEGVNWKPPRRDSWMSDLLRDVGYVPGVVRHFFIVESEEPPENDSESRVLQEIGAGKIRSTVSRCRRQAVEGVS